MVQKTPVWSLVWEDPTYLGATRPMHRCWLCALEPESRSCWAHVPWLLRPVGLEPVLCEGQCHRKRSLNILTGEQPPLHFPLCGPQLKEKPTKPKTPSRDKNKEVKRNPVVRKRKTKRQKSILWEKHLWWSQPWNKPTRKCKFIQKIIEPFLSFTFDLKPMSSEMITVKELQDGNSKFRITKESQTQEGIQNKNT